MEAPVFVLDANVFIEAAKRYYAFDLAPPFWENLIRYSENGRIKSIDRVKHELERQKDDLAKWVKEKFSDGFCSTDTEEIIESYSQVIAWVEAQQQFLAAAKADFAIGADGWLVAYAMVNNCIVVTHEVLAPGARRKVPIPNVCQTFNVQSVDTFKMLRNLGVRFR